MEALLPAGLSTAEAGLLLVTSFFTSALTAAFGLGGGVTLVAIMGLLLPVAVLVPVHAVIQLGSNAGRLLLQRRMVAWPILPAFFAGSLVGALAGAQFVVTLPEAMLQTVLGLFVLVVGFAPLPRVAGLGRWGFALIGALTTFVSMFVGATGPLNAALFSRTFAHRETVVGTMAAVTAVQHALKVAAFLLAGVALGAYVPFMAAMIAVGFAGTLAGTRLLRRLDERVFRLVLKGLLALLAAELLRRGFSGLMAA